jgi:rSAM/selenodomain-associated transferase 1
MAKTRLAGPPEWGAEVARAFLLDTISRLSVIEATPLLVYTPAEARDGFLQLIGEQPWGAIKQSEGDLGARLRAFFSEMFTLSVDHVVVIGSDSPTLPVAYIEQAFTLLADSDVVLGPATDGGYYLIGCARHVPEIFEGIDWSSDRVLAQTIGRLSDPTIRLVLLPPWYDVDTPEGWAMLCGHIAAMRRAAVDPGVPNTETLLERAP